MTKRDRSKPARPIKTRRDYVGASALVKRLSGEAGKDTPAEARLQVLLRELDQFDGPEDDADASADSPENLDYSGPRRRWSDDSAGTE